MMLDLRVLIAEWRAKGAATDKFHATMGIGWKSCADELDAALSASEMTPGCIFCKRQPPPPHVCNDELTAGICIDCLGKYAAVGQAETTPQEVAFYRGRKADELTKEELLEAYTRSCKEIERLRRQNKDDHDFGALFKGGLGK